MSEPATKDDLAVLESKMLERFDRVDNGLRGEIHGMEKRLSREIGHGIDAIGEMVRDQIRVIDEKYADLPVRVGRLEEHDR